MRGSFVNGGVSKLNASVLLDKIIITISCACYVPTTILSDVHSTGLMSITL